MKRGRAATSDQKRFHDWIASRGCAISKMPGCIHHPVGSSAVHKKVWIGQWFVNCLSPEFHQYGPYSRHGSPNSFARYMNCDTPLDAEKKIFYKDSVEYGLDEYLIETIMDYHR